MIAPGIGQKKITSSHTVAVEGSCRNGTTQSAAMRMIQDAASCSVKVRMPHACP